MEMMVQGTPDTVGAQGEQASRTLAALVAAASFDDLPEQVVHDFKRALLDYLACAISGSRSGPSTALLAYLQESDRARAAAVVGTPARLSVMNAALLNGNSAHAFDFDDGQTKASAHPGGAIFPAVLACAEQYRLAPRDVILTVVMGYEVMLRISRAMHPAALNRGFHNTPITGVFGAAAAVSKLLKLDARQTLDALGLAGSFAGGLFEFLGEGADVKRIHPGKAARDGILCAELGRRGVSGPSKVLEGKHGFYRAFADSNVRWESLLKGFGSEWAISDVYFKPYPCCRHLHAVIDAVKAIRGEHQVGASDVKRIDVGIYEVGAKHSHRNCGTLLDAQMSIPCAAAQAFALGDVTIHSYAPELLGRADVQSLIGRVDVRVDSGCQEVYPGLRRVVVRVDTEAGASYATTVTDPKGESSNPMTDQDLEDKLLSNCEPIVGRRKCRQLINAVWQFQADGKLSSLFSWGARRTQPQRTAL